MVSGAGAGSGAGAVRFRATASSSAANRWARSTPRSRPGRKSPPRARSSAAAFRRRGCDEGYACAQRPGDRGARSEPDRRAAAPGQPQQQRQRGGQQRLQGAHPAHVALAPGADAFDGPFRLGLDLAIQLVARLVLFGPDGLAPKQKTHQTPTAKRFTSPHQRRIKQFTQFT